MAHIAAGLSVEGEPDRNLYPADMILESPGLLIKQPAPQQSQAVSGRHRITFLVTEKKQKAFKCFLPV